MAKPRIFISSTFYDLRQIRAELDKFIEGLGYEPVRNEEGDIPYGKEDELQTYCYKEIENVDVLISIIGSRYGSKASTEFSREYSVSQQELKTAIQKNRQVFIFVDKNVLTEYETYSLNKDKGEILYKYVDNINIYKFIEEIKALSHNNNIKSFETVDDITSYLKEQFAGLFKQFFIDNDRKDEINTIRDLTETAKVLHDLVDYLKEDSKDKDEEISKIIKINHPIVSKIKTILGIKYNIYIEGPTDLFALLSAYGYKQEGNVWKRDYNGKRYSIEVSEDIFESGRLKYFRSDEWKECYITFRVEEIDEGLPF